MSAAAAAAGAVGDASVGGMEDWAFKGEGNANIVFAYTGTDPFLVGKVLRLRKARPKDIASLPPVVAELEARVWEPVIPGWRHMGPLQREAAYICGVLLPLIGPAAAAAAEAAATAAAAEAAASAHAARSPAGPPFAACGGGSGSGQPLSLAAAAEGMHQTGDEGPVPLQRPFAVPPGIEAFLAAEGRQLAPGVTAQIISDHTLMLADFLPELPRLGPTVCFEVKPKAGFIPNSPHIPDRHSIKRRVPRFGLHQLLKHLKGKAPAISRYCPLDLFGGDPALQEAALGALMECPYNNLKVFVDGDLVFGGKADAPPARATRIPGSPQHLPAYPSPPPVG